MRDKLSAKAFDCLSQKKRLQEPTKQIKVLSKLTVSCADKILATLGEGTFGKVVKVKELST